MLGINIKLRKKVAFVFILLFLLIFFSCFGTGYSHKIFFPIQKYEAKVITPKDAAYHISYNRIGVEWWYFEGIFDNGYSVMAGTMIFSKKNLGFCHIGLQIYNKTKLEYDLKDDIPLEEFEASQDFPYIKISGNDFIKLDLDRYNNTGEWIYNVTLEFGETSANLKFIGTTKGYRGRILRGWYGPVLPKASVNGSLVLDGFKINVSGYGYHEHANGIHIPIWEYGWNWGKIVTESYNLFWVKMMQTPFLEQQRFAILSFNHSGYIQIKPEYIEFRSMCYKFNTRRIIPTKYILRISDPENKLYLNATMETLNIHHMGKKINHYWRYHVKINGELTYNSKTEILKDHIQMVELVRFPSLIPIW
jgi:hypothetical protein